MIADIRFSKEFERAFKQLKKKYPSINKDFKDLLRSLINNPFQGVELSGDKRKIRLAITSKGKGKSGGARVIVKVAIVENRLSILYIYDKAEMSNVSEVFLNEILKNMS